MGQTAAPSAGFCFAAFLWTCHLTWIEVELRLKLVFLRSFAETGQAVRAAESGSRQHGRKGSVNA